MKTNSLSKTVYIKVTKDGKQLENVEFDMDLFGTFPLICSTASLFP